MGSKIHLKALINCCDLITDGAHKSPKAYDEGFPYVTVKDVNEAGLIDIVGCKKINKVDFDLLIKGNCQPLIGDILFSKDGTVGKVALVDIPEPFVVLSSLAILRPNKKILNSYYFKYMMLSPNIQDEAIGLKTGAAIKRIVLKTIKSIKIPLPPLPEQQRIVTKLDALFAKIDQAISLLEENIFHTKALMGSVLDEELSRFKTKTLKIKDVLSEINSGFACNKSNEIPDGYVHLRTHNIDTSGNLNFDLMVKINPVKVDKKKNQIRKGDILFNNTNSKELVGKTALVDKDYNYGYSNHLTRIRLNEKFVLPEFFVNYMINLHSQGYFLQICKQWIGQAGVNTGMLKETEIKFPSIENQILLNKKIESIKESCTQLINQKTQKLNNLKALKSSLLDQAFNGEL